MAEEGLFRFFQVMDLLRDRMILLLMLRCGLRVGEVSALTWPARHTMDQGPHHATCAAVDQLIDRQHPQGLAPATMNRRLYGLKHVFDFRLARPLVSGNPSKPSHVWCRPRTRPRALAQAEVEQRLAQMQHPPDRALCLLMRRWGLRVSEVARLKLQDIDWAQQAVLVEQGKGRKDRHV